MAMQAWVTLISKPFRFETRRRVIWAGISGSVFWQIAQMLTESKVLVSNWMILVAMLVWLLFDEAHQPPTPEKKWWELVLFAPLDIFIAVVTVQVILSLPKPGGNYLLMGELAARLYLLMAAYQALLVAFEKLDRPKNAMLSLVFLTMAGAMYAMTGGVPRIPLAGLSLVPPFIPIGWGFFGTEVVALGCWMVLRLALGSKPAPAGSSPGGHM